jgi:uncharacterized protein with FMN-binding domain
VRRAIIATAATVAALVAILDYKSHGGVTAVQVATPTSAATSTTTTAPAAASPDGSYTSTTIQYQYGEIKLTVAVANGKITGITLPVNTADNPRSASINSQAVPILTKEALVAQGVHFDAVSGATYTSNAFAEALESALSQEGK